MKKIALGLMTIALTASTGAIAATTISNGGPIAPADCSLLGETVNINLSKDVSGVYACNDLATTVRVGTCHASGSRKATPVACAVVDATTTPATYNDASCDGTAGQTFNIADYRAYVASNQGGSVAAVQLGGNCTDGSLKALTFMAD